MIELRETGIDEILKGLADLPPQLSVAVQKTTLEIAEDVALELYIYPGPRPGSTYIRKETLGGNWRAVQNGFSSSLENDTSYMPFVQDERHQTWFHKETGWKTYQQVIAEKTERAGEILEKNVETVLHNTGLGA